MEPSGIDRARWELDNLAHALKQADQELAYARGEWNRWRDEAQESNRRAADFAKQRDEAQGRAKAAEARAGKYLTLLEAVGVRLPEVNQTPLRAEESGPSNSVPGKATEGMAPWRRLRASVQDLSDPEHAAGNPFRPSEGPAL